MALGITNDIILVLLLLFFTSGVLVSSVMRVDLVAILVLVIIGVTHLLPPNQLFSGFSSEASMSLIGIMIISYSLDNVGITVKIARWILKFGKESPRKTSVTFLAVTGVISSILRSLGTVSLFLPVANRLSKRMGISKSTLLLPMAFCALLGGTLTTIGSSPLLILNSLLGDANSMGFFDKEFERFNLLDVFPIGAMLLIAGIIYMAAIMPLLDKNKSKRSKVAFIRNYFQRTYNRGGDIFELKVLSSCPLISKCLRELENILPDGLSVLAARKKQETFFPPLRKLTIRANIELAIMGDKDKIIEFAKNNGLLVKDKLDVFAELLHSTRSGLSESVIPPSSKFIGQEVRELHMRRNHDIHALALLRGDKVYTGSKLDNVVLRAGDTLGMYSKWSSLREFQNQPDFVVITTSYPREKSYTTKKIPQALFCFFLSVILIVSGIAPLSVSLLTGALGMVLTGAITLDQAYESVSWRTVFLISGLLPLGLVMQTSGTAEWLINLVLHHLIDSPLWVIQLLLSLATTAMALVISNVGATILMVPLALNLGLQLHYDPQILALIVGLSACNTFLIPTHQVNALVAGPGGYKSKEFFRFGGVMTVIFTVVVMFGVNILYHH